MAYNHKSPLAVVGRPDWKEYYAFRDHLRLPMNYLVVIFKHFSSLNEAVPKVPALIAKLDELLWEKQMNPEMSQKAYKYANIPVQYHAPQKFETEKAEEQADVQYIIDNIEKMKGSGATFYFHSSMGDQAMRAATAVLRKSIDKKLRSYCNLFPNILDSIKKWDSDDPVITRVIGAETLLVWGVGMEFTTEFTTSHLGTLIERRQAEGGLTVIVSALTPKEYIERYKTPPPGIVVQFKDMKIKQTLAELKKRIGG